MDHNPVVEGLIRAFEAEPQLRKGDHRFSVSRTVSAFAVLYEKARNAVEFRAEHLVRRAAIERILKRRIALESDPQAIAENLCLELLWAKYIDSSLIDTATINDVASIITRYAILKQARTGADKRHITWDTLVGIASAEIEETIVPGEKRQALINFVYQAIRPKIKLALEPQLLNMLSYIAVERSFAQSDNALIIFHLLQVFLPEYKKRNHEQIQKEASTILSTIETIQIQLTSPVIQPIERYLRKHLPPFLLLRDFFLQEDTHARAIIEDPQKFEEVLNAIASKRYQETGQKVRRAVVRSIIYIFLTKMVLALALEAPVDIFLVKHIDYLPLAINTLFPPLLLFLIASFISIPGPDNTKKLIEKIKLVVYHLEDYQHGADAFIPQPQAKRPLLSAIFTFLYMVMFLVTFGFIAFVLTKLHFNFASQIIFVFFVALVSLFAYRIRQSAKEYEIVDKQGILEPLMDFFFLPILWAGDVLSKEIAKINIFIFFFDFILEAPLKVIFEVVEEWIRFIRTKKEEIV